MEQSLTVSLTPFDKVKELYNESEVKYIQAQKKRMNQILLYILLAFIITAVLYWIDHVWMELTVCFDLYCIGYFIYEKRKFRIQLSEWKKETADFFKRYKNIEVILYQYNEKGIRQVVQDKVIKEMEWQHVRVCHIWEEGIILYDKSHTPVIKIPLGLSTEKEYQALERFLNLKIQEYNIERR